MRLARVLVCALLALNSPFSFLAAQSTTSAPQASVLLQQSLSALTGGHSITDVTLTGSAQAIAGSDNQTGTATLKAVAAGASSLNLSLSSGPRSEILNASATPPTGSWSGPDGTVRPMAFHNLLTGPFWFFPAFALAASSSASGATVTYVGSETHNGQAVQHLANTQSLPASLQSSFSSYPHLTQLDFYLDSTTLLPAAVDFNIHPDNNQLVDIPVEIRFTNYTATNGAQIPFHIQKFINNTLTLDLQFQNASLNTGITVAQVTGN
jgi:hypothetical protein